MNLIQATNATVPVTLAGRVYPVRQLRLREWAALHSWLATQAQNPVELAARAVAAVPGLGPALTQRLFDAAFDQSRAWPPQVGSVAWLEAIDQHPEGPGKFLAAILRAGGTEVDDDLAERIAEDATRAEIAEALRVAYFGDPPSPPSPSPKARPLAVVGATTETDPATATTGDGSSPSS